jgi:hypothetical protein
LSSCQSVGSPTTRGEASTARGVLIKVLKTVLTARNSKKVIKDQ